MRFEGGICTSTELVADGYMLQQCCNNAEKKQNVAIMQITSWVCRTASESCARPGLFAPVPNVTLSLHLKLEITLKMHLKKFTHNSALLKQVAADAASLDVV